VSGVRCQVSGVRFQVSGFRCQDLALVLSWLRIIRTSSERPLVELQKTIHNEEYEGRKGFLTYFVVLFVVKNGNSWTVILESET